MNCSQPILGTVKVSALALALAMSVLGPLEAHAETLFQIASSEGIDLVDVDTVQDIGPAKRFWRSVLLSRGHVKYGDATYEQMRYLTEIDCRERRMRDLQTHYFDRGNKLGAVKRVASDWQYLAPDTIGWRIMTFVCKTQPPEENTVVSGTMSEFASGYFLLPSTKD